MVQSVLKFQEAGYQGPFLLEFAGRFLDPRCLPPHYYYEPFSVHDFLPIDFIRQNYWSQSLCKPFFPHETDLVKNIVRSLVKSTLRANLLDAGLPKWIEKRLWINFEIMKLWRFSPWMNNLEGDLDMACTKKLLQCH